MAQLHIVHIVFTNTYRSVTHVGRSFGTSINPNLLQSI